MKILDSWFTYGIKLVLFIGLLFPILFLVVGFYTASLGANPLEFIVDETGRWAIILLLAGLAVSTARHLFNWRQLLGIRRMLGLYTFFYSCLHVLAYLWFEQSFSMSGLVQDLQERSFILIGMLAFLGLVPLALTSSKAAIKRLGKQWLKIHRMVYVITFLVLVHYWWMVKVGYQEAILYTGLYSFFLLERLYRSFFNQKKRFLS